MRARTRSRIVAIRRDLEAILGHPIKGTVRLSWKDGERKVVLDATDWRLHERLQGRWWSPPNVKL